MDSEGGVVTDIFRDPYSVGGGGVVAEIFRDPYFLWGGRIFPLTAVPDPKFVFSAVTAPKFVLFKHVLCFARIMSTLCPTSCRQTARIGGAAPLPPPVPYAYAHTITSLVR